MGGLGSGWWTRGDRRQTLDDGLQVDVRRLNKQGLLRAGQGGTITWHSGGEATGSIRFACTQRALELRYRRRSSTPDCPPVTQSIAFDRTACNLGGSRVWLLGPHCTRRVAILAFGVHGFICRKCYRLPYGSQVEDDVDRMIRRKYKICERIFRDQDRYRFGKRKGIHQRTYDQLREEYCDLEIEIDDAIETKLAGLPF